MGDAAGPFPQTPQDLWNIIGSISFGMDPEAKILWRGMSNYTWGVESSLIRALHTRGVPITEESVRIHERRAIEAARNWGLGGTAYGHATDLHLLAMMQHHGVPTRLVDVTYNPLTALWFACAKDPDQSGVLVAFMVRDAWEVTTAPRLTGTWGSLGNPSEYDLDQALEMSAREGYVVLVDPVVKDLRMRAQEGLFLTSAIPADPGSPALIGFPEPPKKGFFNQAAALLNAGLPRDLSGKGNPFDAMGIVIPPKVKKSLLAVLEKSFNRSTRTLFPDLSGFAEAHDIWMPDPNFSPQESDQNAAQPPAV